MRQHVRAGNWTQLLLALVITALFVGLGARMVWNSQKVVAARSDIYREMTTQKRLNTRRDQLMNSVAGLKATTRMESRAKILGLGAPDGKNVIVVEPEKK